MDEQPWQAASKVYLLLNKPTGYECSRAPQHHLPVLRLLPAPYVERGVQPVGRLDADTTGLLLLSDDGQFIHHFTSPRRHVPKTYAVSVRHPLDDTQLTALRQGVQLHDEPAPLAALACAARDSHTPAADHWRRQIPSGQAHGGRRRQPGGRPAPRGDG